MSYDPNIPAANDLLSDSQGDIQQNFSRANTVMSEDHYPFADNTANAGKHKFVKLPNGASPVPAASQGGLYAKASGGFTNLFWVQQTGGVDPLRDTGLEVQLTGIRANGSSNGYCALQGGMILQWGVVNLPGTSNPTGTVTFSSANVAFPTSCFSVQLTLQANVSTSQPNTIAVLGTPNNLGFQWVFTGSSSYNKFYWTAIGI